MPQLLYSGDGDVFKRAKLIAGSDREGFLHRLGRTFRKEGLSEYKISCFRHADESPSMSILPSGKVYCFGCRENSVDVIDLVANDLGIKPREAAEWICAGQFTSTLPPKTKTDLSWQSFPAPAGTECTDFRHRDFEDMPDLIFPYLNESEEILTYEVRWDGPAGKVVRPKTHGILNGSEGWFWKHPTGEVPLYNLSEIFENPFAPVLVVEGASTAEAARELDTNCVVTCLYGGSTHYEKANIEPISGRRTILWPDNDKPGHALMEWLRGQLQEAGNDEVTLIDPQRFNYGNRKLPRGFDAGDAMDEGWAPTLVSRFLGYKNV